MRYDVVLSRISNCYYNLGLERARLRDLSGAAELLKKSLLFNKYHQDARNLLGLIFFECGETADALVQWVISMNLNPENNDADRYLGEIQRKQSILSICSDNVKRYNQALEYAKNNNPELAAMQLSQVIENRPNYIKAHILIALLYMQREDWKKAGSSLIKVLKIDRNNPKALVLLEEVKQKTGRKKEEQKRLQNLFSHRKLTDDDVLVPQEIKELSPWMAVGYMSFGLVMSVFAFSLLILPSREKALNQKNNQEIASYAEKLDQANRELNEINEKYQEQEKQYTEISEAMDEYENQNASFMAQYQALGQIEQALSSEDYITAADQYLKLDGETITDGKMQQRYQKIKLLMEETVYMTLEDEGTAAWNAGYKERAATEYELSLGIREEPGCMYLLARLYQSMGDLEKANPIFDRIVGEYPESKYAARARNVRGY